jgi:GNAT superfamily N-acetyltransferase
MIKWLQGLFDFRFPWNNEKIRPRLRPLRLRIAEERDFAFCEGLHVKNEPFGVPTNHRAIYATALRSGEMLTLIAEQAGAAVGCCGITWSRDGLAWYCYALVEPAQHRTGIGTTMFLACLALLPTASGDQKIGISALETSLAFYHRLGFRLLGRYDDTDGNRYPVAVLEPISARLIEDCRTMLRAAGTIILAETHQIPSRKELDESAQPSP